MAAEAVLTFAAEGILNKVLSLAGQEFSLAWGFKAELRKLQKSLASIKPFLVDVAYQPQAPAIEVWVKKLKDVAEDAEDVLDEFKYEVDRRKVEIQNHMKRKVLHFFSLSNPPAFRLQMALKIQKINASLVDLKREATFLGLVPRSKDATPGGNRWGRQTNAFIGRDEIIVGREDAVSKIVTTLTDSKYNQENLAVMAIVGMGGLGKTTLAQSVYNEVSIHMFFEKKMWVSVSNTFDVNLVLLHMLEQLNPVKVPSKDNLLDFLSKELKEKTYLLVLDSVWNEDSKKWENLMEDLLKLNSSKGSKIIVTTRSGKVASISEKQLPRYQLEKLSVEQCWSIMKNRAFPHGNAYIDPEFEIIGRQIAENCSGLPLVAKVLGGILHTKKSIEEWLSFQNSRICDNLLEESIMPVLKLSFDNLTSQSLKQCFAYCSMFKKDFEIQRDNLIQLWMAQGLLCPSPDESKEMEDIGNEYFDILLQCSLFQDAQMDYNGIISKCKMHNLVHDLAELVFKSESLTGELRDIDDRLEIRHAARVSTSILEKISEGSAGKLRSLFSNGGEDPSNILPRFKTLRILNLSNANTEVFPNAVARLKHLRYLDISKTRFKVLPNSIGMLYNLQTLKATNCALEEFPEELQNLINLRYIYFDKSTKSPQWLRRLTCLRTLPYFSVGEEIGHHIEELAGLEQLKGELTICNLEHVKNGKEAKKAKLENKTKVCHLGFTWKKGRSTIDNNEEEDVLQGLRPHPELEGLSIENFMGIKFPSWMSGSLKLDNLKKLQLLDCEKCEGVPPLGHLLNLTELKISGMTNLKCIGAEFYAYDVLHSVSPPSKEITTLFPKLKTLSISGCRELTEWMEEPMMSTKKVEVFPCLEELDIRNCSKLRSAPSHFPFLKKLVITSTDSLTAIEYLHKQVIESSDRRTPIQEMSRGLKTLTSLQIEGIKDLSCLPQEILKNNNNLSSLDIRDCVDLTDIAPQFPPSLETLAINGIPLEILPSLDNLDSLRHLEIVNWPNLKSLPTGLHWPTRLDELRIGGFWEELDSFPDFQGGSLMHLTRLELTGWPKLKSLPEQIKHLTSLTFLGIYRFDGEEILAEWLGNLTSLTELQIQYCNNLKNLPSVQVMQCLTKLQTLCIYKCHSFQKQKCTRGSGTDWHKISHIPHITIEGVIV
ncbi:unnamed protein product [Malus baccata var. baccata]